MTLEYYHKSCTDTNCIRETFHVDSAKAKHIESDCDCQFLKPPLQPILDIITRGYIALVDLCKLTSSVDDRLHCIVAWNGNDPYMTVSYVWSDGLVGCTETGLPTCQIKKLLRHNKEEAGNGLV